MATGFSYRVAGEADLEQMRGSMEHEGVQEHMQGNHCEETGLIILIFIRGTGAACIITVSDYQSTRDLWENSVSRVEC